MGMKRLFWLLEMSLKYDILYLMVVLVIWLSTSEYEITIFASCKADNLVDSF